MQPTKNKLKGAGNVAGPKSTTGLEGKGKATHSGGAPPGNAGLGAVGQVSLKHVWEIAKIKQSESRLAGTSLEAMVKSVVAQAGSIGIVIVP